MEAVLRLTARQLRLLEDACARAGRGETPAAFAVRALAERGDAPAAARPAPIDVPADAVPPGAAAALVLEPGDVLRVEQLAGGQCADLVAWGADDARERLSAARTRALAGAVPGLGARLVSGPPFERPLLELVADTAPGHDLLFPACSPLEYEAVGCLGEPSCAGVQAAAAARFGIAACDVPDPLNLWLHGGVDDAGRLVWRRPATRPGRPRRAARARARPRRGQPVRGRRLRLLGPRALAGRRARAPRHGSRARGGDGRAAARARGDAAPARRARACRPARVARLDDAAAARARRPRRPRAPPPSRRRSRRSARDAGALSGTARGSP